MNMTGMTFWVSMCISLPVILAGCSHEQDDGVCVANADCEIHSPCVSGKCVQNIHECTQLGAISRVAEYPLDELDTVQEAHVHTGADGKTAICYWGTKNGVLHSRYVRQLSSDGFEEEELVDAAGLPVRCVSIHRTVDGDTFFVSRNTPSIVWRKNGVWRRALLPGLQGPEAQGAMLGPNTSVNMTSDGQNGVYVTMSVGFELSTQALYVASFESGAATPLLNGWNEEGAHQPTGHAPQIVRKMEGEQISFFGLVYYQPESNSIRFVDASFQLIDSVEGIFASIDNNSYTPTSALLMDRNRYLRFADVGQTALTMSDTAIHYDFVETSNGQVPWQIARDISQTTHVLAYQPWIGANTLAYFQVDQQGIKAPEQIISEDYAHSLPAGQLSSISTDRCGRATMSFVKRTNESTVEESGSAEAFSVEIVEGI